MLESSLFKGFAENGSQDSATASYVLATLFIGL